MTLNKFSMFTDRRPYQICVYIVEVDNAPIIKYYKQA